MSTNKPRYSTRDIGKQVKITSNDRMGKLMNGEFDTTTDNMVGIGCKITGWNFFGFVVEHGQDMYLIPFSNVEILENL